MPWCDTFIQGKKQFDALPAFIETLTRSWLLFILVDHAVIFKHFQCLFIFFGFATSSTEDEPLF